MDKLLVIDEGTTSTRAILFGLDGREIAVVQRELTQYYPAPGLVEHDAAEIWERSLACAHEMVAAAGGGDRIAAIGIANQRETIVFWDAKSGEPLSRAIVWQDRRTAPTCAALREAGHEPMVQQKTGLLLDPYFSATKIGWALENWPALRAAGDRLRCGTVESYLLFRLTGGRHVSDATNASRTALMDIHAGEWDEGLCDMFDVPRAILPEIVDCSGAIATTDPALFGAAIPICGMAGDQQAATIGQACLSPGQVKATFGTGAFVLANSGRDAPMSRHRLLTTILHQASGERCYALEGSVFVAGSMIQWLRDSLGMIVDAAESETLARSVPDSGGVVVVPALAGLGAPHWRPDAKGAIAGLSFASGKAHIVRAALEAMAHQMRDLKTAFAGDGADWADLRIDGGMVRNDWLAQDLADMLDLSVERPHYVETTAIGAAMLAATGAGLYAGLGEAAKAMRGSVEAFEPAMAADAREARLAAWDVALARVLRRD